MPQILGKRYVDGKNCRYESEKAEEYLRSIIKDNSLIILVQEWIKQHKMIRHLRKEMAKCLGVTKNIDLLGDLLATDDPKSLDEDLQRAGAYRVDMADAHNSQSTSLSGDIDSDSDTSDYGSLNNAVVRSTRTETDQQRRGATTDKTSYESQPSMEHAHLESNDIHTSANLSRSASNLESVGGAASKFSTPSNRAGTPPTWSAPNNWRETSARTPKRGLANDSDDLLASGLAKISIADDGPDPRMSQSSPVLSGQSYAMTDTSPATGTPRLTISREQQVSPLPRYSASETLRYRPSRSSGRHLSPFAGGLRSSQALHRRSWDGGSQPSQLDPSSDRAKEIGRKGEHIVKS